MTNCRWQAGDGARCAAVGAVRRRPKSCGYTPVTITRHETRRESASSDDHASHPLPRKVRVDTMDADFTRATGNFALVITEERLVSEMTYNVLMGHF